MIQEKLNGEFNYMMYRPTDEEINSVIGETISGYQIIAARRKTGDFIDSDSYGIALAVSKSGRCVTWQFHFNCKDTEPSFYWGHYFNGIDRTDFDYRS